MKEEIIAGMFLQEAPTDFDLVFIVQVTHAVAGRWCISFPWKKKPQEEIISGMFLQEVHTDFDLAFIVQVEISI